EEPAQRGDRGGDGKAEYLRKPVLQKQERKDDAQNAEDIGPPRLHPSVKRIHCRLPSSPSRSNALSRRIRSHAPVNTAAGASTRQFRVPALAIPNHIRLIV